MTQEALVAELGLLRAKLAAYEARENSTMTCDYDMLQALMDNVPCLIYFKDLQSKFLLANKATAYFSKMSSPDEMRGKTDFDICSSDLARVYREDELRIMETGIPMQAKDEAAMAPDGKLHWILTTKIPMRNRQGEIIGIIGIGQDITDRKNLELERNDLIAKLQAALAKVNTLNQLLPICASCKKIRDSSGSWHPVEVYVHDHSQASFSHGICPECERKMYSDAGLTPD